MDLLRIAARVAASRTAVRRAMENTHFYLDLRRPNGLAVSQMLEASRQIPWEGPGGKVMLTPEQIFKGEGPKPGEKFLWDGQMVELVGVRPIENADDEADDDEADYNVMPDPGDEPE